MTYDLDVDEAEGYALYLERIAEARARVARMIIRENLAD